MIPRRLAFTPSRWNMGGYKARVVWQDVNVNASYWSHKAEKARLYARLGLVPGSYRVEQAGTVAADGSLTVEPEAWQKRHYRRAVMGGAGVYQAHLWAMLAGKRRLAQLFGHPDWVAQASNTGYTADRFAILGYAPSPPSAVILHRLPRHVIRRWYGPAVALRAVVNPAVERAWAKINEVASRKRIDQVLAVQMEASKSRLANLVHMFAGPRLLQEQFHRTVHTISLAFLPRGKKHRAERRAFHAAARELLRFLRRLSPRRARPPRNMGRVPRPLHVYPTPPAAILAPPAL